jgi:hypothetical protein
MTALTPRCVYFKRLSTFLPSVPQGYETLREEGSTGKYGAVSVSEAERVFGARDGRELAVRIVDTSLGSPLAQRIAAKAEEAPRSGELSVDGAVGFVRYDALSARAEANLWVADRFLVAVTGQGVEDTSEVELIASQLNVAGLSDLR